MRPSWLLIYALQWFALAIVSVHALRAIAYTAHIPQTFCLIFSKNINIMAAIFSTNPPTLPQKIDSREGLFWCKKGVDCECGKMNIYLIKTPFAPYFGSFAAKYSAIWC